MMGVPAKNYTAVVEPSGLDHTGRATVDLGVEKLCCLIFQSAETQRRLSVGKVVKSIDEQPALHDFGGNGLTTVAAKRVKRLSLTTSTLKSIEKKLEPGNRGHMGNLSTKFSVSEPRLPQAKSKKEQHTSMISSGDKRINENALLSGSLQLDPNLLLYRANQNATLLVSSMHSFRFMLLCSPPD